MSELARRILRRGIGSIRREAAACDSCHRTPVPGEFVHRIGPDRTVCSLCLADEPTAQREHAAAERVHASERQVRVLPRAA